MPPQKARQTYVVTITRTITETTTIQVDISARSGREAEEQASVQARYGEHHGAFGSAKTIRTTEYHTKIE